MIEPLRNGEPVVVQDGERLVRTKLDIMPNVPPNGWITVTGWAGRAGPVSVRTSSVHRCAGGERLSDLGL